MNKWWVFIFSLIFAIGLYQPALKGREDLRAVVTVPSSTPVPTIGAPRALSIPALQINAPVEAVAMDADGRMATAQGEHNVAWYMLGAKPGEPGRAVIDGHLDTPYGPSVFWSLSQLKAGDEIYVSDSAGKNRTFVVYDKRIYPDAQFPMTDVFGADPREKLNLITCAGTWDPVQKNYSQRLVIFSVMKNSP